jgi:cysteinyl-tRNA synthetase
MSKSLKNFITIRDVLRKYSGRQVRFLFLLTPWDSTMNFSDESLRAAVTKEKEFNEFFANTAIAVRARPDLAKHAQLWNDDDRKLHAKLVSVREGVHAALCDSFDYPKAMTLMTELIGDTNRYRLIVSPTTGQPEYKTILLSQIARYIDGMMRVFGVVPDPEPGFVTSGAGGEAGDKKLAGVLDAVAAFRDAMRDAARTKKTPQEVLALCDQFRDEAMLELGVRMEDVTVAAPAAAAAASASAAAAAGGAPAAPSAPSSTVRSVWKLADPDELRREREEKRREESAQRLAKARNKADKAAQALAKLNEAAVSARDYFAAQKEKWASFDAEGKPTHEVGEGGAAKELSKSAAKSVAKAWEARDKAHKDFVAKKEKNPNLIADAVKEHEQLVAEAKKLEEAAAAAASEAKQ